MATESFQSDTAQKKQLRDAHPEGRPLVPHKALWAVLLFGWVASYADGTLTGRVVSGIVHDATGS